MIKIICIDFLIAYFLINVLDLTGLAAAALYFIIAAGFALDVYCHFRRKYYWGIY
jgi:hypothetical protein